MWASIGLPVILDATRRRNHKSDQCCEKLARRAADILSWAHVPQSCGHNGCPPEITGRISEAVRRTHLMFRNQGVLCDVQHQFCILEIFNLYLGYEQPANTPIVMAMNVACHYYPLLVAALCIIAPDQALSRGSDDVSAPYACYVATGDAIQLALRLCAQRAEGRNVHRRNMSANGYCGKLLQMHL